MNGHRRKEAREYIDEQIEGVEAIDVQALANELAEHFVAQEGFIQEFMQESLIPTFERMVKDRMALHKPGRLFSLGTELVSEAEFDERASVVSAKFARWLEHAGDKHYRFLDMTREQVEEAISERRNRIQGELFVIGLMQEVADNLQPSQRVRDVYSEGDLASLAQRIRAGTTVGVR